MNIENLVAAQPVFSVIFAGPQVPDSIISDAKGIAGDECGFSIRILKAGQSVKLTVTHDDGLNTKDVFGKLKELGRRNDVSFAIFPGTADPPRFRFAIMDMDSTLINQEVIEELAEFAGVREHVTRVTTMAMEGKLDFHEALRERVKLLAGQPASILDEVYYHRITATPGLEEMLAGFKKLEIKTAVVSGGFQPIVEPFAKKVGIDHAIANTLEIVDEKLTGNVVGAIVDSEVKKRTLLELCRHYGCEPSEAIAIGDGANDLKMIRESGLGIAFCAKQIVQDEALCAINRRRLDDVLLFLH
ncbi:hypothetical protein BH09SUM1_BH09SUM1_26100 [soil metagenome]